MIVLLRKDFATKGNLIFSDNGIFKYINEKDLDIKSHENIKLFYTENKIIGGLDSPAVVQIQVTNRCNLSCSHCYGSSGCAEDNELSDSQIFSIMDNLQENGVLNIQWVGGEVFTRKNFLKFLEYGNKLGFEQSIISNGIFFGKTKDLLYIRKIWEYCSRIQISVDDFKNDYNEFVGKKIWKSLLKGVEQLHNNRLENSKITIATIIRKSNVKNIRNIVNSVKDFVDEFRIGKEIPTGRSLLTQEESISALFSSYEIALSLIKEGVKINHPFLKNNIEDKKILPIDYKTDEGARIFMYIDSLGFCYPFPLLCNMSEFNGGNITNKSIYNIWRSTAFSKYRKVTRKDTGCDGCDLDCQVWPRYHSIFRNNLDMYSRVFTHPGCPL